MTVPKDEAKKIIDALPEDATYEEIIKELAFNKMVQRGLVDMEEGRVISNEEMKSIIAKW